MTTDRSIRRLSGTLAFAVAVLMPHWAVAQDAPLNPHEPPPPDPALLSTPADGPPPPAPRVVSEKERGPARTIRADMAAAFLRFETAFAAAKPSGDALARASADFDRATFSFFRNDRPAAVRLLDLGTLKLRSLLPHPQARCFETLRVRVEPPVWVYYASPAPMIFVRPAEGLSPPDRQPDLSVRLEPVGVAGGVQVKVPAPADFWNTGAAIDLSPFARDLKPARYRVLLVGEGLSWEVGSWTVTSASLDAARAVFLDRADRIAARRPELAPAMTTFRSRAALLKDKPSDARTIDIVTDPIALENDLHAEIAALEAGRDPYLRRAGSTYGVFASSGVDIPCWTHAPERLLNQPAPLVIALHGAGGDECLFMFGYGAGAIQREADARGFILLSPLAYAFTANPAVLDDLIADAKRRYKIDESRIYLIGHSMGGIAASGLAQARAGAIAGAAAIAGLRPFTPDRPSAPVLALGAQFDPIIPEARVRTNAEAAQKAGLPVEYREVKHHGHTLVVGDQLGACLDWLMRRTLARTQNTDPHGDTNAGK